MMRMVVVCKHMATVHSAADAGMVVISDGGGLLHRFTCRTCHTSMETHDTTTQAAPSNPWS